jgi:hypothetical protein
MYHRKGPGLEDNLKPLMFCRLGRPGHLLRLSQLPLLATTTTTPKHTCLQLRKG